MKTFLNAEAMRGLPGDRADVVLLDINMPKVTGIECLQAVKPKLPETQFIIVTSYSDDERLFESLESVHAGGSPMSSYIAHRVVKSFSKPPKTPAKQSFL